jgi:uncharacterized protein YndB with AHSA1/START domain
VTGTLEQTSGGWRLRFVRELAHPIETVWAALTEPAQLADWFPDTVARWDLQAGAPLRFETEMASVPSFPGRMLAVEAPRLLEFTWGEDTLRFELAPTEAGCTLTLLDSIAELGKAARDGAGWHVHLDGLEARLDGSEPPDSGDRWQQVHPDYVARFGPEAATLGPPADARP